MANKDQTTNNDFLDNEAMMAAQRTEQAPTGRAFSGLKSSEGGTGDSEKASPSAITRYATTNIHFPASKQDLISQAKANRAPADVLHVLNQFRDDISYDSVIAVTKEVSRIEPGQAAHSRGDYGNENRDTNRDTYSRDTRENRDNRSASQRSGGQGFNQEEHGTSPAEVERYLKGIEYPTDQEGLIRHAQENKAPDHVLSVLRNFSKGTQFGSPIDVSKEFGKHRH